MSFSGEEHDSEREQRMKMLEDESDPSDPDFEIPNEDGYENDSSSSDSVSDEDGDEELINKFQLEIEDDVSQFRDEHPMRHNVCPESDSDSEHAEVVHVNRGAQWIKRRGDGRLHYRQTFYSGVAFKEAVLDYALRTGNNIKQSRWDQTKLAYKCGMDGCNWRIYCSLSTKKNIWEVTMFKTDHNCSRNGECLMLTDPVIARLFMDKIRHDPENMMPMKIQEMIKDQWKLSATRNQCQEARKKVLRWLEKEYEDQFAHIRGYCEEITTSNPDSTVEVETVPGPDDNELFDRFYVCFHILKTRWKATCRPIIGVDGTFLRGANKGQLLVAIGRDACNKIYPIAWAAVQVENENNWLWFVKLLKKDLDLGNGDGYIIISDRQKGLINAVAKELPNIEHRKCVRHIYGNLKANHGKKTQMKPFIWNLAWSYNEDQFNANLERVKEYDLGVYEDVMKSNPRSWCRAFYRIEGNCCEDVENNSAESFNNTIVKAREKPMMPMLETVRRLTMVRNSVRATIANAMTGKFTSYVKEFLDAEHEDASKAYVYSCTTAVYEVEIDGHSERVDMRSRKCTCLKWDICGIPCEHGYAVILTKKLNSDDYVSDWFLTSRLRELYGDNIIPLRGAGHWARGDVSLVGEPPEPPQRGRKKKSKKQKRKKGINESPSKKKNKKKKHSKEKEVPISPSQKKKRTMHCKKCGQPGHNTRSCAKRAKRGHGEPSSSQSTQPMSQMDQA